MSEARAGHPADRLEGEAPAIRALRAQIRRLASFDAPGSAMVPTLLLVGETGTGKGHVARLIHDSGPRAGGPFIPVNCAAIPDTMLEAELFGFEPGAFTDAKRAKPGLFEAAAGGTLFLDEIDSLSLALQSKLLTAIEAKRIRRLGAVVERPVDVKLLAATQRDLGQLAAGGGFRPDLYHRLAVFVLALPALRERGRDAVVLACRLLDHYAAGYGLPAKRLTPDAEAWLCRYPWPGNVRELGHLMERAMLLHPAPTLDAASLESLVGAAAPAAPAGDAAAPAAPADASTPDDAVRIREALVRTGGNVLRAARLLGLSRDAIRYRMRRHGIERGDADLEAPGPPAPAPTPMLPAARARTPMLPGTAGTAAPARSPVLPAAAGAASPEPAADAAPAWEQKATAIVAVELAWPETAEDGLPSHEPWTEAARWGRHIHEKLAGLGGVALQQSPSLLVWGFGIPRALDQLPERAVHGALAIRQLAAGRGAGERVPRLRIALHWGAMLVDAAAADPSARALPVGETLAVPVRLLGSARPGDIVASADMARRVGGWVGLEPIEATARASGRHPVAAFRVTGPTARRGREPTRRRPQSPFVGRDREVAALRELLAIAATGAGQVVGIVGEPGAGKSRLLYEFRQLLKGEAVTYDEGHCLAHASLRRLYPLSSMVRSYCDIVEGDGEAVVRDKVGAVLRDLGIAPDEWLPWALQLVRMAGPADLAGIDPETIGARTPELFRRMVRGVSRKQPLVLVVENVHWIDPTSEECFAFLIEHLAGMPCLLIMTYRPGYRPAWLDRSYATQLALRPLGRDESRQVVRAVAGAVALPPAVEDELMARAEGNPLFLEELCRSVLEQVDGRARPAVPDTVQAVLSARIDRLDRDDRALLQAAAVIGRQALLSLLERVAGSGPGSLAEPLARLVAAEFLFERSGQTERTYVFKHGLTQVAAYQGLPAPRRQEMHRRVLEALEAAGAEEDPDRLDELARHAVGAASWDRAIDYLRQAGERAQSYRSNREAVRSFEAALGALARLPEEQASTLVAAGDIREPLAASLFHMGDFRRAGQEYRAILALAERLGDQPRLGRILGFLASVLSAEGDHAEAARVGERAVALAATLGAAAGPEAGGTGVWAQLGLARASFALGDYRRAVECARVAVSALGEGAPDRRLGNFPAPLAGVTGRTWLAVGLARLGEFDEAIRHGEAAVDLARTAGRSLDRVWARYGLGRAFHARTDFARAIPLLRQAAALCEDGAFPPYAPLVTSGLASALAQAGDVAAAGPLLERAVAEARAIALQYGHSLILVQLGETALAAGRLAEAEGHAGQALAQARARGERGDEAWALHLSGALAARRGAEEAEAWYGQALALAEDLGMRPLAARCRLSLGQWRLQRGDRAGAREPLAAAVAALRAMGVAAWLARAEEALAGVG